LSKGAKKIKPAAHYLVTVREGCQADHQGYQRFVESKGEREGRGLLAIMAPRRGVSHHARSFKTSRGLLSNDIYAGGEKVLRRQRETEDSF